MTWGNEASLGTLSITEPLYNINIRTSWEQSGKFVSVTASTSIVVLAHLKGRLRGHRWGEITAKSHMYACIIIAIILALRDSYIWYEKNLGDTFLRPGVISPPCLGHWGLQVGWKVRDSPSRCYHPSHPANFILAMEVNMVLYGKLKKCLISCRLQDVLNAFKITVYLLI